jgi:hypothetical protein
MGNTCAIDFVCKYPSLTQPGFKMTPQKTTLSGSSNHEELFVQANTFFHNSNFSLIFLSHARPIPADSKVPNLQVPESSRTSLLNQRFSLEKSIQSEILFESELEKCSSDSLHKSTSKWCRLTTFGFAYFKSQWASACKTLPLCYVPAYQIKEIRQVKNRIQKNNPELFEFEIVLLSEDEPEKGPKRHKKLLKSSTYKEFSTAALSSVCSETLTIPSKLIFGTKDLHLFKQWLFHLSRLN